MCGEIREILDDAKHPNIALALNIKPTTAHYHKNFEEIYFVMEGDIDLEFYDPETDKTSEQKLSENELCVITKGIHHKITKSSEKNKLCVISVPGFDPLDETESNKI